jgi:hypothetical protein
MPEAKPPAPPIPVESVVAWRLERQHLAERARPGGSSAGVVGIVRDLCGSHAQIASAAELALLRAGWMSPVVLERGRAVATWESEKRGRATTITVTPFAMLSRRTQGAVKDEAARLAPFLGSGDVAVELA